MRAIGTSRRANDARPLPFAVYDGAAPAGMPCVDVDPFSREFFIEPVSLS